MRLCILSGDSFSNPNRNHSIFWEYVLNLVNHKLNWSISWSKVFLSALVLHQFIWFSMKGHWWDPIKLLEIIEVQALSKNSDVNFCSNWSAWCKVLLMQRKTKYCYTEIAISNISQSRLSGYDIVPSTIRKRLEAISYIVFRLSHFRIFGLLIKSIQPKSLSARWPLRICYEVN